MAEITEKEEPFKLKEAKPRTCCVSYASYPHTPMCLDHQEAKVKVEPSVLFKAEQIINGDRRKEYGDCTESFTRIAKLWSVVLDRQVSAQEVALCLIQLKVARSIQDTKMDRPVKRDSIVDIAGYAGCLEKIGKGE